MTDIAGSTLLLRMRATANNLSLNALLDTINFIYVRIILKQKMCDPPLMTNRTTKVQNILLIEE